MIKLYHEEKTKVTLLWFLTMGVYLVYSIGWNLVHTLLVKQIGIEYLPYSYIIASLLTIAISGFYLRYADLFRRDYLLVRSLFITGMVALAAYILTFFMHLPFLKITFFFLLLSVFGSIGSIIISQTWTILHDLFRPSQQARIYPIISTSIPLGGVLSGLIIAVFATFLGYYNLVLFWALNILAILPLLSKIKKSFGAELIGENRDKLQTSHTSIPLFRGLSFLFKSQIMLLIGGISLIFWIIAGLQDFQYTRIMSNTFADEVSLGLFFTTYTVIYNISTLLFQLFVTEKVIKTRGITFGLIALPIAMFLGFISISLAFTFLPGLALHYSWDLISVSLQVTTYQITMNVIPYDLRASIRGIIEGWISPLGGLLGGVIILLSIKFFSLADIALLNTTGIFISFIWIMLAFFAQRLYINGLLTNLDSPNVRIVLDTLESIQAYPNNMVIQKLITMIKKVDQNIQIAILQSFSKFNDVKVLRITSKFIHNSVGMVRLAAIKALKSFKNLSKFPFFKYYLKKNLEEALFKDPEFLVRTEAADFLLSIQPEEERPFFVKKILETNNPLVRAGLIKILSGLPIEYLDFVIIEMLNDTDYKVQGAAVIYLWKIEEWRDECILCLKKLLKNEDLDGRIEGLKAIICINTTEFNADLELLLDQNPQAYISSLAGMAYLVTHHEGAPKWTQACRMITKVIANESPQGIVINELRQLFLCCPDYVLDALLDDSIALHSEINAAQQERLRTNMQFLLTVITEEPLLHPPIT